jgi:hypothetical protein
VTYRLDVIVGELDALVILHLGLMVAILICLNLKHDAGLGAQLLFKHI